MILSAAVGVAVAGALWLVARPLLAGASTGPTPDAAPAPRRGVRTVLVAALVAATLGTGVLLAKAEQPRAATAPAAAATPAPSAAATAAPGAPARAPDATAQAPTDAQLAAVDSAVARVRQYPRDVAAHLDLARAYADAQEAQLSTVEYLAVLRLDAANPEANTALALVALGAGQPQQGKKLVDAVLAKHPKYPEALYVRGLINLMGLRRTEPGLRDLRAYLAAAPYGSHRAAVATLLALGSEAGTP